MKHFAAPPFSSKHRIPSAAPKKQPGKTVGFRPFFRVHLSHSQHILLVQNPAYNPHQHQGQYDREPEELGQRQAFHVHAVEAGDDVGDGYHDGDGGQHLHNDVQIIGDHRCKGIHGAGQNVQVDAGHRDVQHLSQHPLRHHGCLHIHDNIRDFLLGSGSDLLFQIFYQLITAGQKCLYQQDDKSDHIGFHRKMKEKQRYVYE